MAHAQHTRVEAGAFVVTPHPSRPLKDPPEYGSFWCFFQELSADRFALVHVLADTLRLTMNTETNDNPCSQHNPARDRGGPVEVLFGALDLAIIERARLLVMEKIGFKPIQQDQHQ